MPRIVIHVGEVNIGNLYLLQAINAQYRVHCGYIAKSEINKSVSGATEEQHQIPLIPDADPRPPLGPISHKRRNPRSIHTIKLIPFNVRVRVFVEPTAKTGFALCTLHTE